MSTPSDRNNFFADFLEDYFAECEDHLTVVRRELLEIEPFVGQQPIERSILNELFRSFHSLKGLSGMVGVKDAEALAHEMESYLRVLRDQGVVLSAQGFDALLVGTKELEQTIASHRHQSEPPNINRAIAQLREVIAQEDAVPVRVPDSVPSPAPGDRATSTLQPLQLKPEEMTRFQRAVAVPGTAPWHFIFIPTPELSANGINVTKIRDRLQSLGDLIYAAPRMTGGGKIEFDFLVVTPRDISHFQGWDGDGLSWLPYLTSEDAPPPPLASDPEPEVTPPTPGVIPATPLISQGSNLVRVDLPKLDELMRMMGDLVITRARLDDNLVRMKERFPLAELRPLIEINQMLERQLRDLREGVMRVRLVPVGEIFARMQFVVRDLVRESQKQVRVELRGQETEIDKFVVERMMDPLLHLVRNAVSHGLETQGEREEAGKPIEGTLSLAAKTCGEMVMIEIQDDGRGIDQEKVMERGIERGLVPDSARSHVHESGYDPNTLLEILCTPGFSTRDVADLASGRGVGMAIVKKTVQELGGMLTFETVPGQGTKFLIELPLTLAIADALIVSVSTETYAIPQSSIREAIALSTSAVTVFEQNEMISYRGKVLPLLRLGSLFNLQEDPGEISRAPVLARETAASGSGLHRGSAGGQPAPSQSLRVVIVGSGLSTVGIAVDRILGQREIVVRALTDPLVQVAGISGATELGDGRVVLILDAVALVRHVIQSKLHP